ncbi:HAD-IIB family hydrolase [Bisgaard Taxon 45]
MTLTATTLPATFPRPTEVQYLVCCDMDETYIPYQPEKQATSGIKELEHFLLQEGEKKGILLGWITGTNKVSALRKANRMISRSPHFLCCSLGTEFYWIKAGKLVPSETWQKRLATSCYQQQKVDQLVEQILAQGITLERQPEDYQGPYKTSFHYLIKDNMENDFARIRMLAEQAQLNVVITKANPAVGDPGDSYDVEFIPTCCGKDQAVRFLMEELRLNKEQVLAFGDSANDFAMFAVAGHGYLVSNAEQSAIEQYGKCLDKPYCHGILSILSQLK